MAPRKIFGVNRNGGGSSTMTMEMPTYPEESKQTAQWTSTKANDTTPANLTTFDEANEGTLPSPTTANTTPVLQRWNHPRINIIRVLATFWDFMILGANDAAYGALIPYLETYYGIDYITISLVFLSPIVGYTASALTNNMIHNRFGQRGVAAIMSVSHLVAYIVIALHPPYPVLVVVFMLAGFGNGLGDSGWNAWIGDMANANEVLGFLHGMYGFGALLSPLIATSLITQAGWEWYQFYYFMIGASLIEVFFLTGAFWKATGEVYRAHAATLAAAHHDSPDGGSGTMTPVTDESPESGKTKSPWQQRFNPFHDAFIMNKPIRSSRKLKSTSSPSFLQKLNPLKKAPSTTAEAVNNRVTILSALFLLFYVGAEVSIGGWIVTFMLRVRSGTQFASGVVATGFWLGVTLGRFVLGFVTARCFPTEKHAVATYLVICIVLQLLFWLIPSFNVSAVMVGLLGFFIAPFFPAAVVAMTKLLPKRLHVAAVGFAAAVGASGATVLPFAVGAIAQSKGVMVLQPIVLALLVVITFIWLLLPKLPKQRMS
ncbi:hypothetical protein LTS08_002804 [Lithohypha guttulata]|nr:hypothetical protein LTS08_002804 [Lithohypha guttulata]